MVEQRVRSVGQPSAASVSDAAAADVDDGHQRQVSGTQSRDDLLSCICFHVPAEEDELEAIFLPDRSAGPSTSMSAPQTPSSPDTADDGYDPTGFTERDYLNTSSFEELLNAFPLT
ncbi:hypothetical protein HDU80_000667 [Chytriomyces hyalinus]|nr:hypothetical protein HDU80_000667 [Chytriomyces hyalinus]